MCAKRVLLKFMTSAYMLMIKHQYSVFALILLNQLYHGAYADIEPQPNLNYDDATIPTVPDKSHASTTDNKSSSFVTDLGFIHAFVASISVILVSELGDKTFFIAAIMAMRHPRLVVFSGAIAALGLMTVLSAVFGMAATIIPRIYTYYISTALFAIFGLKMLKDGYYMSPTDAQEELEEVQSDLKKREDELLKTMKDGPSPKSLSTSVTVEPLDDEIDVNGRTDQQPSTSIGLLRQVRHSGNDLENKSNSNGDLNSIELKQLNKPNNRFEKESASTLVHDPETGSIHKTKNRNFGFMTSRILMQAFTMTFLAEWGDRSQLTTIILGAREDVYGVIVGGVLGHSICTGLAVIGGRMIAQRISVRTVTLVGGVVFLLFALSALFFSPDEEKPAMNP
ncbi:transmembrane protein 165-like isoform X1 [Bradysia coprophila]|uniref:transmembrane protein 165-like isoform X1 n=1 Tax=Bradysia coprophila TaxID=38358 RepID=UPI00187DCB85|nr:transmembrane protein 165-like isoform X1 [Bradysia coprophila]XP_037029470.1 transmembrane protein 165-like isoform X1 [Bradysia coprophila]